MNVLKTIFIFLLLLYPLGELTRFQLRNDIAVSVNDIGVGLLVLFWAVHHFAKKKSLNGSLIRPIALFIVASLLALVVNIGNYEPSQLFSSSLYLVRWVFYACLYFVVREFDPQFKKRVTQLMVFVGSLIVLGGYVQYFFYPNLRNLYYAGWDEHLYRMFSSFLDPNFVGVFFVLYAIFVSELLLSSIKKRDWQWASLYGIIEFLAFFAVFLTFSRSAIVMLLLAFILFLTANRIHKKTKILILAGFVSIGIVTIILAIKFFQSEGTNLLRTTSSIARVKSAQNAITIFRDNPIFGVGFNTYRYAQEKYGFIKKPAQDVAWPNHAGAGTDNSFLFVLATTGIVGFFAYLYLLKQIASIQNPILFSSLAGVIVSAFFVNSLFYLFIMEWLWIVAALKENT